MKKEEIRGIFKKDVLAGKADGKDIMEYIQKWTDIGEETGISLSSFLGLSDTERKDWITKKRSMESIADEWKVIQLMGAAQNAVAALADKRGADCAGADGDTVFGDLMAKRNTDVSGTFKEMMEIYMKSPNKEGVSAMFQLVSGFSMEKYLTETVRCCQKETAQRGAMEKARESRGTGVPQSLSDRARNICQCFVLTGICTEMYIVNALARVSGIGDGEGHFSTEDFPEDNHTVDACTSYLMYQFSSSIPAEYKTVLRYIIRTGKLPDRDVVRMVLGEILSKEEARRVQLAACNDPRFPVAQNRVFWAKRIIRKVSA